jgi:hypothetical protein
MIKKASFIAAVLLLTALLGISAAANRPSDWSEERLRNHGQAQRLHDRLMGLMFTADEIALSDFERVYPDYIGGLYYNDSGRLVVQITEGSSVDEEVEAFLSANAAIIVRQVEFSHNELMNTMDALNEMFLADDSPAAFDNVCSYALSTSQNRVVMWLKVFGEREVAAFRESISDSPLIVFEQSRGGATTLNREPSLGSGIAVGNTAADNERGGNNTLLLFGIAAMTFTGIAAVLLLRGKRAVSAVKSSTVTPPDAVLDGIMAAVRAEVPCLESAGVFAGSASSADNSDSADSVIVPADFATESCRPRSRNARRFLLPQLAGVTAAVLIVAIGAGLMLHFLAPETPPISELPTDGEQGVFRGLPVRDFRLRGALRSGEDGGCRQNSFVDLFSAYDWQSWRENDGFHIVIAQVESVSGTAFGSGFVTFSQSSTLRVLQNIHGGAPETIQVVQFVSSLQDVHHEEAFLREGGVYVLPLWKNYSDGEAVFGIDGGLDVLFEIDDFGRVFSHSEFANFRHFDGLPYGELVREIERLWLDEELLLAVSDRGGYLREFAVIEAAIPPEYTHSSFYSEGVRYYEASVVRSFGTVQVPDRLRLMIIEYSRPLFCENGEDLLLFESHERHLITLHDESENGGYWFQNAHALIEGDVIRVPEIFWGNFLAFYDGATLDELSAAIRSANRFSESERREFRASFEREFCGSDTAPPVPDDKFDPAQFEGFYNYDGTPKVGDCLKWHVLPNAAADDMIRVSVAAWNRRGITSEFDPMIPPTATDNEYELMVKALIEEEILRIRANPEMLDGYIRLDIDPLPASFWQRHLAWNIVSARLAREVNLAILADLDAAGLPYELIYDVPLITDSLDLLVTPAGISALAAHDDVYLIYRYPERGVIDGYPNILPCLSHELLITDRRSFEPDVPDIYRNREDLIPLRIETGLAAGSSNGFVASHLGSDAAQRVFFDDTTTIIMFAHPAEIMELALAAIDVLLSHNGCVTCCYHRVTIHHGHDGVHTRRFKVCEWLDD